MRREEIYQEIKNELGQVPGFFKSMPEESLVPEWSLFKTYVLREDTAIPPKYRELIGIAAAAARQCWYCSNFHTGVARLNGATDEEIREANHLAKLGTGWSAYLNGTLYDRDKFMQELTEVGGYLMNRTEQSPGRKSGASMSSAG